MAYILWCGSCLQAERSHCLASLCHSWAWRRKVDRFDDHWRRSLRLLVTSTISSCCLWRRWDWGSLLLLLFVLGRHLWGEERGRLEGLLLLLFWWSNGQRFSWEGREGIHLSLSLTLYLYLSLSLSLSGCFIMNRLVVISSPVALTVIGSCLKSLYQPTYTYNRYITHNYNM